MSASAKIALVTGAGTGVGRAVAIALAKAGYSLVLAGRRKEMLDKVSGEINAVGAQALAVPTDVSKRESILALFATTKSTALDCRDYDICCGQVDIGNAATPLTDRMVQGDGVLQPSGAKMIEPRMEAEHVGNAVVYMASLPLDINVLFMTVMANKMPFVGRG